MMQAADAGNTIFQIIGGGNINDSLGPADAGTTVKKQWQAPRLQQCQAVACLQGNMSRECRAGLLPVLYCNCHPCGFSPGRG
jgi:hypothetical protein